MADDLTALARQLRAVAATADKKAERIVKKGALNIKNDWQRRMRMRIVYGHPPHLPPAIGFDVVNLAGEMVFAHIGPDYNSSQGPLAAILEFGSANNAPHNDGGAALRTEAPKFYGALARAEGGFE